MAKTRTSYKPGQSGNPSGRPAGIKDKRVRYRELLEPHAGELADKAIELAKNGDVAALKLCIERLIPTAKDSPVEFNTGDTPAASAALLMASIAAGDITPSEGATVLQGLAAQVRIEEVTELRERLSQVEARLAGRQSQA